MAVQVLFFASLRERLGEEKLTVAHSDGLTPATLRGQLIASGGDNWAAVLGADNVLHAVNQIVVAADHPIVDGDEVAFFPPVTGG